MSKREIPVIPRSISGARDLQYCVYKLETTVT